MYLMLWIVHLKIVKILNFMSCMLYHNFLNAKNQKVKKKKTQLHDRTFRNIKGHIKKWFFFRKLWDKALFSMLDSTIKVKEIFQKEGMNTSLTIKGWLNIWKQNYEEHLSLLTCNMLTISTLLKKIKDVRVERKFSSKTDGVGKMMSWMYCTL